MATASDAGAFVDEAKLNIDTGFRNLSNDLAHDLFSGGTGSRGQVGAISGTTTVTITLADVATVVNFEVGMTLVGCLTDGGAPVAGDSIILTNVNRSTGVVIGTATGTPGADWSVGSFLVVQGDIPAAGASGTGSFLKVSGLSSWIPTASPSSTAFWGVDRSTDPTRLGGIRYDGRALPIEEALVNAASLLAREGAQPEMCFINFSSYAALENSLGSKVQYVSVEHDMADIAFAGIRIHAPYGPITIVPDRSCPSQIAYLLSMETWKFRSLGKAPHVLTYGLEGLEGLRVGNADALEIRLGLYGNLICNAPGWNAVVQLSQ